MKIVKTVLRAYELVKKKLKLGVPVWKLFYDVDVFLRKKGYMMKHALGHGIGKRVHEKPNISLKSGPEVKIEKGMFFTIEPGIYVKGLCGCRIEDVFFADKNSIKKLTNSRLIIIK